MKILTLLLALLPATALADGRPAAAEAQRLLHEAESHAHQLRRLNATDALLEVQLRIANKLQECRETGYPCTGTELLPSSPAPAVSDEGAPTAPQPMALPRVIGIYQGRAQLQLDTDRRVEVRAGQHVGPWRVRAVEVDALELTDGNGNRLRLPIERTTP